jgi:hypothetical protein
MQVDIDGFECEALLGSRELLARFPPRFVVMEWGAAFARAATRRGCSWRDALAPFVLANLSAYYTSSDLPFDPMAHMTPKKGFDAPAPIYWAGRPAPIVGAARDCMRTVILGYPIKTRVQW